MKVISTAPTFTPLKLRGACPTPIGGSAHPTYVESVARFVQACDVVPATIPYVSVSRAARRLASVQGISWPIAFLRVIESRHAHDGEWSFLGM